MRVLVVDPGERAGWATATIGKAFVFPDGTAVQENGLTPDRLQGAAGAGAVWRENHLHVHDHGILSLKAMALRAYKDIVVNRMVDVLVCETYKISGDPQKLASHKGSDVPTLQLYGMVRGYTWLVPGVTFEPQGPGVMNDALRSMNSTAPGAAEMKERLARITGTHDNTHDKSALMHLWQFYFRKFV